MMLQNSDCFMKDKEYKRLLIMTVIVEMLDSYGSVRRLVEEAMSTSEQITDMTQNFSDMLLSLHSKLEPENDQIMAKLTELFGHAVVDSPGSLQRAFHDFRTSCTKYSASLIALCTSAEVFLNKVLRLRTGVGTVTQELDLPRGLARQFEHAGRVLELESTLIEEHISQILELQQRRNLFTHNGGIVDSGYRKRIVGTPFPELALVTLTPKYLFQRTEILERCCCTIGVKLLRSLFPPESFADFLLGLQVECLDNGRHALTADLRDELRALPINRSLKQVAEINYLLSLKRQGNDQAVRRLVDRLDIIALSPIHRIAWYILKDELDEAMALLTRNLDQLDLTPRRLREWPLFAPLRQRADFGRLATTVEASHRERAGEHSAVEMLRYWPAYIMARAIVGNGEGISELDRYFVE